MPLLNTHKSARGLNINWENDSSHICKCPASCNSYKVFLFFQNIFCQKSSHYPSFLIAWKPAIQWTISDDPMRNNPKIHAILYGTLSITIIASWASGILGDSVFLCVYTGKRKDQNVRTLL